MNINKVVLCLPFQIKLRREEHQTTWRKIACEGALAAGREKEGELVLTFIHLH